ncbi:MAG: hypothetical protein GY812_11355 [Actinomycetia bacterium]|nr:hypothetical protein [Actinomycetes bacterium]
MPSVSATQDIKADSAVVWDICVGMEDWVAVVSAIEKVERLDDGDSFGLGTRWRETRTMFGKTATEDMEVTEYDEGRRYATEAESHGAKYFSEITVEPAADRSRLTMSFRGEPQSTMAKIMDFTVGRLMAGSTRKAIAADLVDIGAAAEAAG